MAISMDGQGYIKEKVYLKIRGNIKPIKIIIYIALNFNMNIRHQIVWLLIL